MDEIKVGEYIRTKYGIITKIVNTDEYCRHFGERLEDTIYIVDDEKLKYRLNAEDIKKHSFNIIDLIEEGDYVNGEEVIFVYRPEGTYVKFIGFIKAQKIVDNKFIKLIVTKEMFQSVEYRVESN